MVIKNLLKIAIDLERSFYTNQGLKGQIREQKLTGGQPGGAQQAALRAPQRYCRGNAAFVAFPRQYCGAARAASGHILSPGSPLPWWL